MRKRSHQSSKKERAGDKLERFSYRVFQVKFVVFETVCLGLFFNKLYQFFMMLFAGLE